jgi:hypothetical protein
MKGLAFACSVVKAYFSNLIKVMKAGLYFSKLLMFFVLPLALKAQVPFAEASRVSGSVSIDGHLNEEVWSRARPLSGFKQYVPTYNAPASFKTEVRILYTDHSLLVGAMMYDPHPDSILGQLGNRDAEHLNTDEFCIEIDTYGNSTDAYIFTVTAANVQLDRRFTDDTFDAVWRSSTQVNDSGWIAEIEIPFSAIRFPRRDVHQWGLQLNRGIRRYRETDQWALEVKGAANNIVNWGQLSGISNVNAPVRLSLTPYMAVGVEHYPFNLTDKSNFSYSFSGGMDLKYGLNESFTLDVSLLPDFSQVKSDNIVKNLSAFEVSYDEQRPFFKEAVDLFQKGNLFYSRRIAATPSGYYSVLRNLHPGEEIKNNPANAHLINAVKFSGRNKSGTAIGVLNALTDNATASIVDSSGHERTVLTEPFTNFNIVVVDQALRNNSSAYLINTSVIRDNPGRRANVTGGGITLNNKGNVYGMTVGGAVSQVYTIDASAGGYKGAVGYKYDLTLGKISGNWQYSLTHNLMNDKFDANDLGITRRNSQIVNRALLSYAIYEPFWRLRNMKATIEVYNSLHFVTHKNENLSFSLKANGSSRNYTSYWGTFTVAPVETFDHYESRVAGRIFKVPTFVNGYMGFSTDYRKAFALDGEMSYSVSGDHSSEYYLVVAPLLRINNHLMFTYSATLQGREKDRGFALLDSLNRSIFGRRQVRGVENSFNVLYVFKNNLSVNLWVRHYWYKGKYDQYYVLNTNGYLDEVKGDYQADFNFNSFNLDLTLKWEFAPGSNLTLVWKNALLTENQDVEAGFFSNLEDTFRQPQLNNISLKVLYYLDYQNVRRWLSNSNG